MIIGSLSQTGLEMLRSWIKECIPSRNNQSMIYQCYFSASQRANLFVGSCYCPCGITSETNPDLSGNVPECNTRAIQDSLCEYVGMLYIWRTLDQRDDSWIGFTSYRQLDKVRVRFDDASTISAGLEQFDVIGWAPYEFFDHDTGLPLSIADQAERDSPGILTFLREVFDSLAISLPPQIFVKNSALMCSYWVTSRDHFNQFMRWSFPIVVKSLESKSDFLSSKHRSLGYVCERLFVIWYYSKDLRVGAIGHPKRLRHSRFGAALGDASIAHSVPRVLEYNQSLSEVCGRAGIVPKGIIHVGANTGQESAQYYRMGVRNCIWIEACHTVIPSLRRTLEAYEGYICVHALISDRDNAELVLRISNNGAKSSSIYDFDLHKRYFPNVRMVGEVEMSSVTLDTVMKDLDPHRCIYDTLVLDVQGAELLVLQGATRTLERVVHVFVEVSIANHYKGGCSQREVNEFLCKAGFVLFESFLNSSDFGDCYYVRSNSIDSTHRIAITRREELSSDLLSTRVWFLHGSDFIDSIEFYVNNEAYGMGRLHVDAWSFRTSRNGLVLELFSKGVRLAFFDVLNERGFTGFFCLGEKTAVCLYRG